MRYTARGAGSWDFAFNKGTGGPGDWNTHSFGAYRDPGSVTSPSTYFQGFGQTTDDSGSTDSSATSTPSWLQNLTTGVTQFFVGRQQLQTVAEINQINIQRAAAGLPPISPNIMQPGVNVGLSPDVQNILVYGGLGIAAIWLLTSFMKR